MCLCVRLQDPHEKPSKDDPKYLDKARNALFAKMMSGEIQPKDVTMHVLQKLKQFYWRKDYKAWHKRHNLEKKRAQDEANASLLAELEFDLP